MSPPDIRAAVNAMQSAHVVVVGDCMLDTYVYGTIERISPEAPVPVLRVQRRRSMLGGAGNVLRNLHALGAKAHLVSVIGQDQAGDAVAQMAQECDARIDLLHRHDSRPTAIKTRFVAQSQQVLRADEETTAVLNEQDQRHVLSLVVGALTDGPQVLLISDYAKGVLPPALLAEVLEAAATRDVATVVDPKGADYARYRGATVITPNRAELALATGLPADSDAQVVEAAQSLRAKHGFQAVLATRGEKGISLVDASGTLHIPAEAFEVFDVSGAGDTVAATFAAVLGGQGDVSLAARIANRAAGIVVGKVGTAVTHADELRAAFSSDELHHAWNCVQDLPRALETIARWRKRGESVGFTNGCFDLLHPGHVHLLTQARKHCDRLVVGLNSDASVKRLKGETRPVQDETARATVLASLESVDLVVVFEQDTPTDIVASVVPEVLIKGADYKVDEIAGADTVLQRGGRVELVPLLDGHSTTETLARLEG